MYKLDPITPITKRKMNFFYDKLNNNNQRFAFSVSLTFINDTHYPYEISLFLNRMIQERLVHFKFVYKRSIPYCGSIAGNYCTGTGVFIKPVSP